MSEALDAANQPTTPNRLTAEELVALNDFVGNHEAKLAVAGIYAILPHTTVPKAQIRKQFFKRQLATTGNPTAQEHVELIERAGGWAPKDTCFANWCTWSLEPAGLLEETEYDGQKGPQVAWRATELAVRALPYIGGLGEWSLNYADVSLQMTGATKSTSTNKARAPQIRHSIFRKLVGDPVENPSTYQDLEQAAIKEGLSGGEVADAALELTYQGLLTKNPPNYDGKTTLKIADKYQEPIRDLVQTLQDITTPEGAELYVGRAMEILNNPELFMPLVSKGRCFSNAREGQIATHAGLQERIMQSLRTLGHAEVSSIYRYLQTNGRTVNRHTIHKTMQEIIQQGVVEAFEPGSELALSNIATTYALK